jgi:hypothetical protein
MSNAFGPLAGPTNWLEIDSGPWNTTASSDPTFSANVELKAAGLRCVVDKLIWMFEMTV